MAFYSKLFCGFVVCFVRCFLFITNFVFLFIGLFVFYDIFIIICNNINNKAITIVLLDWLIHRGIFRSSNLLTILACSHLTSSPPQTNISARLVTGLISLLKTQPSYIKNDLFSTCLYWLMKTVALFRHFIVEKRSPQPSFCAKNV